MRRIIVCLIGLMTLAACGGTVAPTETPPPTNTLTPVPTDTLTPTPEFVRFITETFAPPTPLPTGVSIIDPVIETDLVAPLHIDLPEGWLMANAAIQMPDGGTALGILPFTIYRGPVTGGTADIMVIWGFRNVTTALPFQESGAQIDLRADGLRLLNLAVLDPGCNIGIDVNREFKIGNGFGAGAFFAAQDCPTLPDGTPALADTKGWFVVTQQSDAVTGIDLNFAFYVYTDPPAAMDGAALSELQAIMDTVVFDMSLLPTAVPQATDTETP